MQFPVYLTEPRGRYHSDPLAGILTPFHRRFPGQTDMRILFCLSLVYQKGESFARGLKKSLCNFYVLPLPGDDGRALLLRAKYPGHSRRRNCVPRIGAAFAPTLWRQYSKGSRSA